MLWSDCVHLGDPKYHILDPSNYAAHEDIIQPKQYAVLNPWDFFNNQLCIVPPILSTLTALRQK